MKGVLAVVLGGGAGTRLHPLTQHRSKPSVPFGGKYRIIDVPLSSCLNSGLNRVYLLTQFNSASLNQHVAATYRFSQFSRGFVHLLAAEQTPRGEKWFQGTADAVRQVFHHLESNAFDRVVILSGDQLYQMDLEQLVKEHVADGADITVATTPVTAADASGFGILQVARGGRIERFVEKPKGERLVGLETDTGPELIAQGRVYLASMGIYVFERRILFGLLADHPDLVDFGRDVIPFAITRHAVRSHPFSGYWTDIGTIASFFDANLAMTHENPPLELHDPERPVYTHARNLPPSEVRRANLSECIVAPGVRLVGCRARRSVIGIRSIVRAAEIEDCVLMGSDEILPPGPADGPPIGIGDGSRLVRTIVDRNVRIGRDVTIVGEPGRADEEGEHHVVRDGIVVIRKNAVIPDGTTI